jgi:hypothetical protein
MPDLSSSYPLPVSAEDAAFVAACRHSQLEYIERERLRYRVAAALDPSDRQAFAALNLHQLTAVEIAARLVQLDEMEREAEAEFQPGSPRMKSAEFFCNAPAVINC